ncbi:hypothetical protein B0I33_10393 [Prauserella shujinwangii]|uniref:PE family protein n=1 Tax=Prauserella shujinwangii TaxID=1453103 RepID=A0A2T0LY92_9PSEU|nr:hypothetical protein [Prauserella shujinwangii]PRX49060.1 hypothetical protein B0I33_10393 [Prauserella shujinwangii]
MADESWVGAAVRATQQPSATEQVRQVFGSSLPWADGTEAGKPSAGGSGAFGSWTFDREEIDALIAQWEQLLEDVKSDKLAVDAMMNIVAPPSGDDPSNEFVETVTDGLRSMRGSSDSMVSYIQHFLDQLRDARDRIDKTEAENQYPFQAANGLTE